MILRKSGVRNYIIKRDNFSIGNSDFHGITDAISDNKGVSLNFALEQLYASLLECNYIVAHNLLFDEHIILNHAYRVGDPLLGGRWHSMKKICTMKDIVRTSKYVKLQKLYQYYFDTTFEGAHNAMNDVNACAECFIQYYKS